MMNCSSAWRRTMGVSSTVLLLGVGGSVFAGAYQTRKPQKPLSPAAKAAAQTPLVTGKAIVPQGTQTAVGSFPNHLLLSPNRRFMVVTSSGARSFLSVLDTATGKLVSQVAFNGSGKNRKGKPAREGLYYGLAFGPMAADGSASLYAARGSEGSASVLRLDRSGKITDNGAMVTPPAYDPKGSGLSFMAGIALTPDGRTLIAANNTMDAVRLDSTVYLLDAASGAVRSEVRVPGYPFAVSLLTAGPSANRKVYVGSEQQPVVSVIDPQAGKLLRTIPVGSHPMAFTFDKAQKRLFVANAKGVRTRTPNNVPFPPAVLAGGYRPKYIQSLLEGTVSTISVGDATKNLASLTRVTLAANHFYAGLPEAAQTALKNPGIQHIIYIVKENRTYDQVLGDLPQGNGDKSLVMFGREVTPNLHALAERFVLLDNFYCCAEVSADGWNWSTSGMANEFTARNVPYGYTGRKHANDYKGVNSNIAVERKGVPDVATAAGGYIWDQTAKAGITFRNYGFYTGTTTKTGAEVDESNEGAGEGENAPYKKALVGNTDADFRQFDLTYADSEAWVKLGLKRFLKQRTYGKHLAPSRFTEWRREFDAYVKNGNLPRFEMVRLGTDHTRGTTAGVPSARAFVADNDYAVGQLVDAVSHSRYWKSTAIFVLEDDAQNGADHVDCHRSPAYVISPFIRPQTHDSRFYNTDSFLHTMDCLMGLPPLNQYVAIAPTIAAFGTRPINDAPFNAILPNRAIISERNEKTAYRAKDSARFYSVTDADSGPDDEMNDIMWHAIKGLHVPQPPTKHGLRLQTVSAPGQKARKASDPDD